MRVSEIKKMLEAYSDDDHLVIAWWDKSLFYTITDDLREVEVDNDVWIEACQRIDQPLGSDEEIFDDITNSTIHENIASIISVVTSVIKERTK